MSLRRRLLPILQTIVVLAAICWFGEVFLNGFAGLPDKAALRVMDGTCGGPRSDALIEVAVSQRGETWHRLFTLYPRVASRGKLQRGEQLKLLVNSAGMIVQIESADSGIRWSYEEEQRRHRRVLSTTTLAAALALIGCGLLYLLPRLRTRGTRDR